MPTYEMICTCSSTVQEVWATISEYDKGLTCQCGKPLKRAFITAPSLHGAENPEYKSWGNKLDKPLRVVTDKPDGGVNVKYIGQKKDLSNV